jgi:hypothetical protein
VDRRHFQCLASLEEAKDILENGLVRLIGHKEIQVFLVQIEIGMLHGAAIAPPPGPDHAAWLAAATCNQHVNSFPCHHALVALALLAHVRKARTMTIDKLAHIHEHVIVCRKITCWA